MILSMDGRTLARRTIQPMTAAQVKWFMDGPTFLARAGDLYALHLAIVCQGCQTRGLTTAVKVVNVPNRQVWLITCEHRGTLQLPYDGTPRVTDELLAKIGWTLRCTQCAKKHIADGVEGGNGLDDTKLTVNCGCTERVYQMPTVGRTS